MYYLNWPFLIKMVFFVSAVIFHYTIHRKAVASDIPPPNGKLVACVSLVLWGGVIFGGIFIGFVYPGLSIRVSYRMLLSFAQWIQLTGFFTALRGSAYVYPIVMSLHMVGIAFFGGMVLMTDMRLLGWAMRKRSICGRGGPVPRAEALGFAADRYLRDPDGGLQGRRVLLQRVLSDQVDSAGGGDGVRVGVLPQRLCQPGGPGSDAERSREARSWRRRFRCCFGPPSPAAGAASATSSRRSTRSTPSCT